MHVFPVTVENGKLKILHPDRWEAFKRTLKDGRYKLIVKPMKQQRTLDQNSYYWGVVLPTIADETGHDVNELHDIFKQRFLQRKTVTFNNKDYEVTGSSTDLSTQEFSEYIERIKAEMALFEIIIPEAE